MRALRTVLLLAMMGSLSGCYYYGPGPGYGGGYYYGGPSVSFGYYGGGGGCCYGGGRWHRHWGY
jgi:hypothetical protein